MFYAFMVFDEVLENALDSYVGMNVDNVKKLDYFTRLLEGEGADEEDAVRDCVDTAYNELGIDDMPCEVDLILFETDERGHIVRASAKVLYVEASRVETVDYQTSDEEYCHTLQYEG